MNKKRILSIAAAGVLLLPSLTALAGCGGKQAEVILRVYSWEEYIDEGGEGTFLFDETHELNDEGKPVLDANGNHIHIESEIVGDDYMAWYEKAMGTEFDREAPAILDDFELWYENTYGISVRVEYATFGTNEDMYNEIILGNEYDLLCPSDYMIMKLAAEGRLEPYDKEFFDTENELNYYVNNVSPYIQDVFKNGTVDIANDDGETETHFWSEYAAGYMWGTTGFVYNPSPANGTVDVAADLERLDWGIFTDPAYKGYITAKDNVRDTYFAALGVTYQDELSEAVSAHDNKKITEIFNRTDEKTVAEVRETLMAMKNNIYGWETDTGKTDLVKGNIWLNYAWSGDAVYAMDLAESEDDMDLNYFVPEAGSNLWFDGWVMTDGVTERGTKHAAQAFVNFMSMPQNAMRNSYYIGYTSVIAGEEQEMLDYAAYLYGVEDEEDETEENYYDLKYFFGTEAGFYADEEQRTCRQLYTQYPPEEVIARCAVMNYFDADTNERINTLWSQVKSATLDAWAITVICVAVVAIALFIVFVKFGGKIDFFRTKPKKGYELVKQENIKN